MDTLLQVAGLGLIAVLLGLVLKKGNGVLALLLTLAACAAMTVSIVRLAEPVVSFLSELRQLAGLEPALLQPLLRTVGIGLRTQLTASVCADAGESTVARLIELCGSVLGIYTALPLLEAVEKEAEKQGIVQDILLEVNIGGEASKSGISPEELSALAAQAVGSPHVRLRGLMAIPPVAAGPDGNRPFFAKMRQLYVDIRSQMDDNKTSFDCLSMGMSGDFEDAVREGATLVRVGTALFGPRPPMHKG